MKVRRRRNSNLDDNSGAAQDRPPLLNFGGKNQREYKSGQRGTEESVKLSRNHILGQNCWPAAVIAAGLLLAGVIGLFHAWCVYSIHENLLWFSQLKEVEREISFRTECGLYYSYYKQMLKAPSIQQGLYELIHDNTTESKRTINILQRMNIYQEVFLSILYRILPIQTYLEPIYFYIYTVFALQTVYVIALFITSWLLSDSWLAGALSGVWYILNRVDTTRVEFTISLRENWSIPFFALQVAAITCYLRPQLKPIHQRVILWLVFVSTFCFCLTWQFNQFVLLVQALIIFTLDCLDFLTTEQVVSLYLMQVLSLLLVWLLQFCNSMILGSLVLSFIVSALFIKHFQTGLKTGGFVIRVGKLALHTLLVLTLTFTINYSAKKILQLKSDEHIFKFIKAKFGFGATRDFDASLYLCEEAFGLLPLDTFERLAGTVLLYPYLCTLSVLFILLLLVALSNLSTNGSGQASKEKEDRTFRMRPDVAYNLLHTVFFGLLAFSTMRLKTPKRAVFAGSMQLLAGIKLCTGRVLTNHPHYEDQALRERTRQVYQIYARQSAEEVHKVLCSVGADYIVLEDSICYERRHSRGCRLRDLLDLANGHIMDGPGENEPDLILATHPRFCEAIKTDMTPYSTLFTRVFKNKTFHVYKLKKLKKKNKAENGP
ncbi:probable C-mannosyltransferase DPY19L3 isoform X3 [Cyprinus carpio]|uniref:Probable C-mannosyltransferase DPY19L3 isoform X3 n=1 Tax=Cyprinus carpio TaxID=7962 RepID=A0A9Q9WIL5_CYPCA|nr:probable C-mannosyltransferase DPY19L3 isoform X3 [Cyprinus carpio]